MTVTRGLVTEIRTVVDPERGIEVRETGVAQEKVSNPGVVVDLKTDTRVEDRVKVMPEIETDLNHDPDPLLVKVQIEINVGAIDTMSMIILQENVLMMQQVEIQMMPKALF